MLMTKITTTRGMILDFLTPSSLRSYADGVYVGGVWPCMIS